MGGGGEELRGEEGDGVVLALMGLVLEDRQQEAIQHKLPQL